MGWDGSTSVLVFSQHLTLCQSFTEILLPGFQGFQGTTLLLKFGHSFGLPQPPLPCLPPQGSLSLASLGNLMHALESDATSTLMTPISTSGSGLFGPLLSYLLSSPVSCHHSHRHS